VIFELKLYVSVVNVQIRVYPLYKSLLCKLMWQDPLKLEHSRSMRFVLIYFSSQGTCSFCCIKKFNADIYDSIFSNYSTIMGRYLGYDLTLDFRVCIFLSCMKAFSVNLHNRTFPKVLGRRMLNKLFVFTLKNAIQSVADIFNTNFILYFNQCICSLNAWIYFCWLLGVPPIKSLLFL